MIGTASFFNRFMVNKEQDVRFQAGFHAKPLIIEGQFFQNVTVLHDRYILFFGCFFVNKRTKREISDQFLGKSQYNRSTNLTKRNGFLCQVHRVFFTGFWTKKEQKVRFQTDFKENTLIIEQQFFQNVTVFNDWYILFFRCFLVGVIFTTFELLVKLFP